MQKLTTALTVAAATSAILASQANAAFLIADPDTSGAIAPDVLPNDVEGFGNTTAADFAALPGVTVVQMNTADSTGSGTLPGEVNVTGEYEADFSGSGFQFAVLTGGGVGTQSSSADGYLAFRNASDASGTLTIDIDGVDAIGMTLNNFTQGGSVSILSGTDVLFFDDTLDSGINFVGYTREAGEGEITQVLITLDSLDATGPGRPQAGLDDFAVVSVIPEPASIGLLAAGLGMLVTRRRAR